MGYIYGFKLRDGESFVLAHDTKLPTIAVDRALMGAAKRGRGDDDSDHPACDQRILDYLVLDHGFRSPTVEDVPVVVHEPEKGSK